jgi:succinyl-diaminopimelate desuccinylase
MKSGVAAFAAAAIDVVSETPPEDGAVILAITGDEEGPAVDGTAALLDWMAAQGEAMSVCLVGEPTSRERLGDTVKIGRRGSLSAFFTVTGKQGHSAYPHRARNPLPALVRLMDRLASARLDEGTEHFDPSTLAVVTIDTGNPATNVIPAQGRATVNIRFNDRHTGESLTRWLESEAAEVAAAFGVEIAVEVKLSGEAFLTPPGALSELVTRAVEAETGVRPELSTSGGTSDARFVKDHCAVVEFGLTGRTMHQVDEHVPEAEITALKAIYRRILRDYFG